ncbi:hypothetical protein AGMMS50212_06930 [Spirochaetia bacterium]|nr:hypothetical protein AGMMS50212_06930 [Spirochaetia bacterium]
MSIRVKTALMIIGIVLLITAANLGTSFIFTDKTLVETMNSDLSLALNIADDLVSTRINLLKSDAQTVAERLKAAPNTELEEVMREQHDIYPDFLAFTVFDREGIISSYGAALTPPARLWESRYIRAAFEGQSIISTTRQDQASEQLVINVCVPMDEDRVLVVTIPGMLFSRILSDYRLWKTGNIFMVDEEGTFIANFRDFMVLKRYNFLEIGQLNINDQSVGVLFEKMINTEKGTGKYTYDGAERFCIYKRVSGSAAGWRIAVAAPFVESPAENVFRGLLIASLLFFGFGTLIAVFMSGLVAKPFYQIEEQKQHLEELNEVAIAASEAKTTFLANMSHEMRTPLNAIIGLSELSLDAGDVGEESLANLDKIYNAGMTLLGTVNDILDISKIEAGKFEIIPVVYDIPSLINDTVVQNILRIGEKLITFSLRIDETLPSKLYGDELRIKQILNNLLSNAFKYTREGTVILSISCVREGDTVWFCASITDSGIGIRNEDINKLFSNYNQVDTKANRKIEGTGLGLSITKHMTEMMGGSISVESEYGKGSTFTAKIKQGFVTDEPIGSAVAESLRSLRHFDHKKARDTTLTRIALPYARVLIVDDVSTNLDVARGMMKPYCMKIDCVTSGHDAIELIRSGEVRYNAIFMDHMMPEMDGIEATRIIREEIGTDYAKNIPIIALTANAIRGNDEMFIKKGFQDFLSKPIDIMQLDTVIRQWIRDKEIEKDFIVTGTEGVINKRSNTPRRSGEERRSGNDRRLEALKQSADNTPTKPRQMLNGKIIDGIDLEAALERFGGDEKILMNVLSSYARETSLLLDKMRTVTGETLSNYVITVHGIKGSSLGICAESVGAAAEALEYAAKDGNFAFVAEHNGPFIEAAGRLITDIYALLKFS